MNRVILSLASLSLAANALAATYTVSNISDVVGPANSDPRISANGDVAWVSNINYTNNEIVYYDSESGAVSQITNNEIEDGVWGSLRMNSRGDLVWLTDDGTTQQLFYYERATQAVSQITNDNGQKDFPAISDNGDVVWAGWNNTSTSWELFQYSSATGAVTQLTNDYISDRSPEINGRGDIVWSRTTFASEIFLREAASGAITQLSISDELGYHNDFARINDNGDVVWATQNGGELRLYQASTGTVIPLPDSAGTYASYSHQINNRGDVVWSRPVTVNFVGVDEVYLYSADTGVTTRLTNNDLHDSNPQINNNGDIVWRMDYGVIHYYDAATQSISVISEASGGIFSPQLNDNGDVVWNLQTPDSVILLATPTVETAQCEIINLDDEYGNPVAANAVNNQGQVLITSGKGVSIWDNGTITPLTITGAGSYVSGIDLNDVGQVVVKTMIDVYQRSFLWENGVSTDLGTLGTTAVATKLNNNGQIIGWTHIGYNAHAFLWENGVMQNLGRNNAADINDAGQIGGTFNGRAGIWDNGQVTPIPYMSFFQFVTGINNQAETTGWAWVVTDPVTPVHSFLANDASIADLGTVNGLMTMAQEVNDNGTVVGAAFGDGNSYAFVTKDGVTSLLVDKLPPNSGWEALHNATDINNAGQIIGQGRKDGVNKTFLMSGACL
ncbi:MAG: hypothetical protein LJE85_01550 [Gammaproteobacteria bacterium]|nr:hypothetical protein [Gammaproteobacteria bacterium]